MRRSFGFGGSNMGGGRGGGSAQMIRSIQRVYQAGEGITTRSAKNSGTTSAGNYSDKKNKAGGSNSTVLTLNSCTSPRKATSSVLTSTWPSCPSPTLSDESDWECVGGFENETAQCSYDDVVFGRPPSTAEVQNAIYSLQGFVESAESAFSEFSIYDRRRSYSENSIAYQVSSPTGFVGGDSPFGAKLDWKEPSPILCNSSNQSTSPISQLDTYEALCLLHKDSEIQLIAESLSTDKAVWDAVLNNKLVRELRRAYYKADNASVEGSDGDSVHSSGATDTLSWLVAQVKSKITQLMENITRMLNEMMHHRHLEGGTDAGSNGGNDAGSNSDGFDGKVKLSLFVTFVVFLSIVLQRMKQAGNSST